MTGSGSDGCDSTERLIELARGGSSEALGQLMEKCRQYLLLVANRELESDVHAKLGASDLVQETFLEAQRDFGSFQGHTERQLLAWFRRILLHNLANEARRYRETDKRQVAREVPLAGGESSDELLELLAGKTSSPSERAIRHEQAEATQFALERLPEQYRQVIQLRERDGHTFEEIGQLMSRSADAARMLWFRAVEHLARELGMTHES
jgi:RNA polymerase sigma-70 factor (ECF subfamily)